MTLFERKDKIQKEAFESWIKSGYNSLLALATGVGKSRIGLLACQHIVDKFNKKPKILLVVPTEKLRDDNWPDEFKKWKMDKLLKYVRTECYVSINKIQNEHYDLVVLDECHRITTANAEFFDNNKCNALLAMTATPPEDDEKKELLKVKLKLKLSYNFPVDLAVKEGLVSPFKIKVIELTLSNKKDYVVNNKGKKYTTSEKDRYDALTKVIQQMQYSGKDVPVFMYLNRMRFIYNLPSKTELAKKILHKYFKGKKHLIFAGDIKQADELCEYRFHSKTDSADFDKFVQGKIDKLSCVKALNEGINVPNLDAALITQVNSKELNLIQQIGRTIRYRDGHEAEIYILSVLNTKDEDWVTKALSSFNPDVIEYINVKNLKL